jgi:hypothetical protein
MQHTHAYQLTPGQQAYFDTEHEDDLPENGNGAEVHHGDDNAFETKGIVMEDMKVDNLAFFNVARDEHTRFTFDYA